MPVRSDPNRLFHFNSFTGDYTSPVAVEAVARAAPGAGRKPEVHLISLERQRPPGGTGPPPTVAPPPVTLTGTGKPAMKGCIITLSHNAPDRRVFARLDACAKTGDASVQTNSQKADVEITDKNTTDNTAASPPPK